MYKIVLIHPNPQVLKQLDRALTSQGYTVFAFSKVKLANKRIIFFQLNNIKVHRIIVPSNLKVYHTMSYKEFLNELFPKYPVVTIDNKDYRDTINLRQFKQEFKNA